MVQSEKEKALYETAGRLYKAGFSCSESVFRAFCEELSLNMTPESIKVASGFGGGMSFKEGACGAATGGVMVLGVLAGRTEPTQDKKPMKELTHDFITQFTEKFGGLSCGCLNSFEHGSPAQKENCCEITSGAAALLMRFIEDRGLYSGT